MDSLTRRRYVTGSLGWIERCKWGLSGHGPFDGSLMKLESDLNRNLHRHRLALPAGRRKLPGANCCDRAFVQAISQGLCDFFNPRDFPLGVDPCIEGQGPFQTGLDGLWRVGRIRVENRAGWKDVLRFLCGPRLEFIGLALKFISLIVGCPGITAGDIGEPEIPRGWQPEVNRNRRKYRESPVWRKSPLVNGIQCSLRKDGIAVQHLHARDFPILFHPDPEHNLALKSSLSCGGRINRLRPAHQSEISKIKLLWRGNAGRTFQKRKNQNYDQRECPEPGL